MPHNSGGPDELPHNSGDPDEMPHNSGDPDKMPHNSGDPDEMRDSGDPDEMPHYAAFQLGLRCLSVKHTSVRIGLIKTYPCPLYLNI